MTVKVTRHELVKLICGLEPKTLDQCLSLSPKYGKYFDRSGFQWNDLELHRLTDEGLERLFYTLL
jgi:hypothetical protein